MTSVKIIDDYRNWLAEISSLEKVLLYQVSQKGDWDKFIGGLMIFDNSVLKSGCSLFRHDIEGGFAIFFGHLAVGDNQDDFDALVREIIVFAKSYDAKKIIGPIDGSTWFNYRVSATGVTNSFFLDLTHPQYFSKLFDASQLNIARQYFTFKEELISSRIFNLEAQNNHFAGLKIQIRNLNLNEFESELRAVYNLNILAFKNNFLFSPITFESFYELYKPLKTLINPDIVLLAENQFNELLGFAFAIDDFSDKSNKGMVVKTIARKEVPEAKGLGYFLSHLIHNYALNNNYDYLIHAFVEESNKSLAISSHFNGERFQRYNLYEYDLVGNVN